MTVGSVFRIILAMRAILISTVLLVITVLVLTLGQLVFERDNTANASARPWVDVLSPKAFLMDAQNNEPLRELVTGDELTAGARVKTDTSGLIEIHLADGSVLRLDSNTELVLEDGQYNSENQSLIVRVNLLFGRVWSKVVGLATPESVWEIKTSNAVATVRGTAFGVEFIDGVSNVIGSENQVAVAPIDPTTNKAIAEAEVLVGPEKFVEIRPEKIRKIRDQLAISKTKRDGEANARDGQAASAVAMAVKAEPLLVAEKIPARILKEAWVDRAKKADKELEDSVKELEKTGADKREIYREALKTLRKNVQEKKIRPAAKELEGQIEKEIINKLKEAKIEIKDLKSDTQRSEVVNKFQKIIKKVEIPVKIPNEDRRLDQNMNLMKVINEAKDVINNDAEALKIIEVKPVLQSE